MSPEMTVTLPVALLGLAFGSFLNVCIHRLPLRLSIVKPRSRCPQCKEPIALWDNVPVLSYLVLRGRCRRCRNPISPIYPLVEVLTGGLFWITFTRYGFSPEFVKYTLLGMLLLILIFTDLQERLIPHVVTVFGILVGTALSWLVTVDHVVPVWLLGRMGIFLDTAEAESFLGSLAGALVGGGSFYLIGTVFYYLKGKKKEYLGFGDVMLMTMVGCFLGVSLTLLTMFLGSLLGTLIGVPLEYTTQRFRQYEWPFGTYLGAAALVSSLWGGAMIDWYLQVSGIQ